MCLESGLSAVLHSFESPRSHLLFVLLYGILHRNLSVMCQFQFICQIASVDNRVVHALAADYMLYVSTATSQQGKENLQGVMQCAASPINVHCPPQVSHSTYGQSIIPTTATCASSGSDAAISPTGPKNDFPRFINTSRRDTLSNSSSWALSSSDLSHDRNICAV